MVSEFARVQQANGDGSICGFPNSKKFAEEIRKGNVGIVWNYWVAWYNMHKPMPDCGMPGFTVK